jgi:hypothetical protein
MPTLLLTPRQTDDTQKLWRACIAEKWKVERVHNWRVPVVDPKEVAVYGEPLFAHHVAQTLGLKLLEPAVDWLPNLDWKWRGRDVQLMTLAEARKIAAQKFIKPAEAKSFEARIYTSGAELPGIGILPDSLAVLSQEVVEWPLEFRCFILNRRVITVSPYWRDGELAQGEDESWKANDAEMKAATQFCESVLLDPNVFVPEAVVIDVGMIKNQGWAVIESNAAWGSGTYGCDGPKVLSVLRQACCVTRSNQ